MGKQYILAIDRGQSKIKAALCNDEVEVVFVNQKNARKYRLDNRDGQNRI